MKPLLTIPRLCIPRLLVAGAMALCAVAAIAAQDFPQKPITLVVPHSPGGTSDLLARAVSVAASKILGQPIVVDNRDGANGTIAAKRVASAAPDGYTLLLATASTHGINPTLYPKISYSATRDFVPVTLLATVPNVLVVNKAVPARNVQELIEFVKGQNGKANMGSAGAGTPGHLAGEMFKSAAGLQFTHVPYRGGAPAINDLLGGQVEFLFTTIPGVLAQIKAGNLRALAVTSTERSGALPDVPTMVEAGVPDFRALSWHGIVAPAGTPPAVVEVLDGAFSASLANPGVKERLEQEGAIPASLHTGEFGKFIAQEIETWGKAVKNSGASAQ